MKMKKELVQVSKSGSVGWLIFWLIIFFPIGILYWLFKMRKTKTYQYENSEEDKGKKKKH